MPWHNAVDAAPILVAIYGLDDSLTDLAELVLPFDGPPDDRIDYDETYAAYVVACATLSDRVVVLLDLIDASMPD